MNSGIFSRLIEDNLRSEKEARTENYVMVNVRPGEKVGALLDLMSRLTGKTTSALMADKISEEIADYAASSIAHETAILDAAVKAIEQDGFWLEGALALLQERGIIQQLSNFVIGPLTIKKTGPDVD